MSPRLLRLFLVGLALTLVGVVGMGVLKAMRPESSLKVFLPIYGIGLAALVVALFWWLVEMTRRREAPPTARPTSTDQDR